ncbi:MAG: tRNA (adenosine(37)-N6)-threonylcarbamoyltransferase complex ATPase subunit type 1 TsaE [Candidatus Nanopelagicales bacterium]
MTRRWSLAPGPEWRADAADADAMRQLGQDLAQLLQPGDLVLLNGRLGAGKTTLTQGLGAGLGVRGSVTSPTFVIARVHPGPRVDLVHVDAYRLAGEVEVDDLDLDTDLDLAVTVVEWGEGKVEGLSAQRLEVSVARPEGALDAGDDPAGGQRSVTVRGIGARWEELRLP